MNTVFVILNLYFAIVIWNVSKLAFNENRNVIGWTAIFFSALNAASAASIIF